MSRLQGSVALADRGACRAGWSSELTPQIALASSRNATASRRLRGLVGGDLVVAAAQVLHERVPGGEDPQPGHGLDPAHRAQPPFQLRVVGLDPVVGVPLDVVPGRRPQLVEDPRVGGCPVGDDLGRRHTGGGPGPLEEPAGRLAVPPRGRVHVDDLPELVDRPVQVHPPAGDLHVGLVDVPAVADPVPGEPGRVGQQRREPLHPPVHGDVVDVDAALGQQLLDVPVGQAEPQIPAHRQHDHLRREPEPGERRASRNR